jgi:hypothetical protein
MSRPGRPQDPRERPGDARQVRLVAIVLASTMVLWMFASWAGGFYGWQPRFAFLFDFLALAAFGWALFVTYGLWRARRARDDK